MPVPPAVPSPITASVVPSGGIVLPFRRRGERGRHARWVAPSRGAFAVQSLSGTCARDQGFSATAGAGTATNHTMNEATIRLRIENLAGGRFLATSPDVPGLVAEGRSVAEATEIAQGLARKIAESCIEHGDPVPPALTRSHEPGTETGLDLLVPVSVP